MKKYDGAILFVILVVSTFVIFTMADMFFSNFTAKYQEPVYVEFGYIVDKEEPQNITFTTGDVKYVFEDSIISRDIRVQGYTREDGLFVPAQMLVESNYKGGSNKIDTIEVNPSEEVILLANGINPHAQKALSKWESN